jgi:hypothetical protein
MWERAKTIAAEMLDGKLWLPEVGKATHYHAYWVRPGWVREMTKMHKLGVHTFYRPRKWGDGEDAPEWGDPDATQESARKLVEAAKKRNTRSIDDDRHLTMTQRSHLDVSATSRLPNG